MKQFSELFRRPQRFLGVSYARTTPTQAISNLDRPSRENEGTYIFILANFDI